jgi:kynureninase
LILQFGNINLAVNCDISISWTICLFIRQKGQAAAFVDRCVARGEFSTKLSTEGVDIVKAHAIGVYRSHLNAAPGAPEQQTAQG